MEQRSPTKKRTITFKKMEDILHHVQNHHEKKFNPGQV
jgi:hypothetical protein